MESSEPSPCFHAGDYGAVGDGNTLNTAAIQRAIDEAAAGDPLLELMAGGAGSSIGRGGMLTKVLAAGIDVIANPQPAGAFWGVRGGHNASTNAAINLENDGLPDQQTANP